MKIGTITLTRPRVYFYTGSDVVVEPGEFPVFEEDGEVYWVMPGQRNAGGAQVVNHGGGLITATVNPDKGVGEAFEFESRRMSRSDFDAMNRNDESNGALVFQEA
jgi:hypothetical protein